MPAAARLTSRVAQVNYRNGIATIYKARRGLRPKRHIRTGGTIYGIRHLFTGQEWYSELGLYNLRNRYYSPDIGRFLQADPASFGGDATNLYRYCGNSPLTRSDPFGDTGIITVNPGGSVSIRYPVEFSPAFTPAQQQSFVNGVHQYWDPAVNVSIGEPTFWKRLLGPVNTVYPTSDTSHVVTTLPDNVYWNSTVDGELGAAHEFGHSVGAPHVYNNDPTELMSGDVRPDPNARVSATDVANVAKNGGRPVGGSLVPPQFGTTIINPSTGNYIRVVGGYTVFANVVTTPLPMYCLPYGMGGGGMSGYWGTGTFPAGAFIGGNGLGPETTTPGYSSGNTPPPRMFTPSPAAPEGSELGMIGPTGF